MDLDFTGATLTQGTTQIFWKVLLTDGRRWQYNAASKVWVGEIKTPLRVDPAIAAQLSAWTFAQPNYNPPGWAQESLND